MSRRVTNVCPACRLESFSAPAPCTTRRVRLRPRLRQTREHRRRKAGRGARTAHRKTRETPVTAACFSSRRHSFTSHPPRVPPARAARTSRRSSPTASRSPPSGTATSTRPTATSPRTPGTATGCLRRSSSRRAGGGGGRWWWRRGGEGGCARRYCVLRALSLTSLSRLRWGGFRSLAARRRGSRAPVRFCSPPHYCPGRPRAAQPADRGDHGGQERAARVRVRRCRRNAGDGAPPHDGSPRVLIVPAGQAIENPCSERA